MSIVNSVSTLTGVGNESYKNENVALSGTGQQTKTVPSSGSFSPAINRGYWRVKIYGGGGTSPTLTDLVVNATDGTNTVTMESYHPNAAVALSATSFVDTCGDFIFDYLPTASASGTAGALLQYGATLLNFLTTMGGTSPTATADYEVAAQP
jgi:hypothetical protein